MSYTFQRTEAIILRVFPFGDYDTILHLFTIDAGVIKVLFKGSRSRRRGVQGICLPLTKVEVVYLEKKSEIFSCREMTLLEPYHFLRKELVYLEVACDLLSSLAFSQFLNKPAPLLYQLLSFYLKRIPGMSDPWALAVSFRLKLLMHEGLSSFPLSCFECSQHLFEHAYSMGTDWLCPSHYVTGSLSWSGQDIGFLQHLAVSQHYRDLQPCRVSPDLKEKMDRYFRACFLELDFAHF